MRGLLVAGTSSDAGKSIVTSGLCRAFARRGVKVAPFKAQNMSNNSMVVVGPGGTPGEIGRAQWVQALAAGVEPEVAMNPVLLKPGSDRRSHVVVRGRPAGEVSAVDFVNGRAHLARAAYDAFDELSARFDVIVAEGAGSPTEINLRSSDYVNMGLAQHGNLPVVLVGDIDRGGVFASLFGSVALLAPDDQRLVVGFVVNRFRGDESLLAPGLEELESLTGRRVYGVLPFSSDVWLDSEDTLDVADRRVVDGPAPLRVVVVRSPRISNFTDIDALGLEPGVDVGYASDGRSVADADLVVLPGSRATLADLAWMRARGIDRAVVDHAAAGRPVLGICGGFQMLGRSVTDPAGVEGAPGAAAAGLGLLDVTTTFAAEKVLRLPRGQALGAAVGGYEIHHGRVQVHSGDEFLGGAREGHVFGTMWHGCLEHDDFRAAFLAEVARMTGHVWSPSGVSFRAARERRLDLLGDLVEHHLDVAGLLDLATSGAPPGLPVLPPGDRR
jgi:adenosylcobyric acid synthase